MTKKLLSVLVVAIAAMAGAFASGNRETATTIEGKLTVTKSVPTIVSGGKTYALPPGAFYQIAWENGVKAGDTVKAEGYARTAPEAASSAGDSTAAATDNAIVFVPTKVWVNGKAIDLSTLTARGKMGGNGMRGGTRYGNGCYMDSDNVGRGMMRGR